MTNNAHTEILKKKIERKENIFSVYCKKPQFHNIGCLFSIIILKYEDTFPTFHVQRQNVYFSHILNVLHTH